MRLNDIFVKLGRSVAVFEISNFNGLLKRHLASVMLLEAMPSSALF